MGPKAALGVALASLVASWGAFFPAALGKTLKASLPIMRGSQDIVLDPKLGGPWP